MFNAFENERRNHKTETLTKLKESYIKSLTSQQKIREKLAKKNKQRVQNRIIQMSLDPVPIARKFYPLHLKEFKGPEFFRHRPKDAGERIEDARISNIWLDTVPLLPSPPNFRPRFKSKEIQNDMKFTPKDRYERVSEAWKSQQGTVTSSWQISQKNGEMFPSTLRKSYYKTVESVALDARTRGTRSPLAQETDRTLCEIAQEVMDKCKLRPLKDEVRSSYQSRSASLPG